MGKHYVPQEYLRGFAVPGAPEMIWMFDKQRREWSRPAIAKAAQQRDWFTPDVEKRLSEEIESPGHAALKKLRAGPNIDHRDRAALGVYVAVMIKRVPTSRRKGMALLPEALDTAVTNLREVLRARHHPQDPQLEALLSEVDRVEAKLRNQTPDEVLRRVNEPWANAEWIDIIERMTWRLIPRPAGASPFITSDNPAYFFEFYGLGSEQAELTFPVSTDLVLHGSHQGTPGSTLIMTVPHAYVKEMNRRVASGAERFVFAAARERWIETLALRPAPFLSRIIWPASATRGRG